MPSADFCTAVRSPYDDLSLVAETQRRSPEVRPTAFTARPPNLPPRSLMTVDFAITCSLVRPGRPRYPVFVHRAAALLHAFFRPHLAATPLRFASPSPSSGWTEDFHLQAVVHTRHTRKTSGPKAARQSRVFMPSVSKQQPACFLGLPLRSTPRRFDPRHPSPARTPADSPAAALAIASTASSEGALSISTLKRNFQRGIAYPALTGDI